MTLLSLSFNTACKILHEMSNEDIALFVLRHGESLGQKDANLYKRLGDDRIPLTKTGYKQSRRAGIILSTLFSLARTKSPVVLSSTGERSLATGAAILHVLISHGFTTPFLPDRRLDKQKFGEFDGLFSDKERSENCPAAYSAYKLEEEKFGTFYVRPPGGESIHDVQNRIEDCLTSIPADGAPRVIVTHGTNTLCIENITCQFNESWVLENQDKRENGAIRVIVGSFKRGFKTIDIEDRKEKSFQPTVTMG